MRPSTIWPLREKPLPVFSAMCALLLKVFKYRDAGAYIVQKKADVNKNPEKSPARASGQRTATYPTVAPQRFQLALLHVPSRSLHCGRESSPHVTVGTDA
jgi:hypothetical protein